MYNYCIFIKYFVYKLLYFRYIVLFTICLNISSTGFVTKAFSDNNYVKYILPNSFIYKSTIELPSILSEEDIKLYYKIFNLQYKNNFKSADALISKLSNKILLGYIYYERYESKGYISKASELKKWLNLYYSLPVANDIYLLYKRKSGKKFKHDVASPLVVGSITPVYTLKNISLSQEWYAETNLKSKKVIIPRNNKLTRLLNVYLKKGKTKLVKNLLLKPSTKNSLGKKTYAYYCGLLSRSYFMHGRDEFSLEWGERAIKHYREYLPEVNITMGLVNWRQGNYTKAIKYFNFILVNKHLYSSEIASMAIYWCARCYFKINDFKNYYSSLILASNYYYSFYGILASEELGISNNYTNNFLDLSHDNIDLLLQNAHVKRALALLQFGLIDRAEQELILFARYYLKKYSSNNQIDMLRVLVYLAKNVPMPMLSVYLAGIIGMHYGFGYLAYPIFYVGDGTEYIVDPLLIYSIMRQESHFYSRAISKAGAIGLMQLMPDTAKMIIRNTNYNKGFIKNTNIKTLLKNPKCNFDLGQIYIKTLLFNKLSESSLIYTLAAWNGGLLNVKKWREDDFRLPEDPLFFIESIPFVESRNFVKKVLTDFWIYQIIVGVKPYSVFDLINNKHPLYIDPTPLYIKNVTQFKYNLEDNKNFFIPNNNNKIMVSTN